MTSSTDRKNQITNITYDALNRRKLVTYQDGSTTTYTWDNGNRLTQIVDSLSGTITQAYDDLDRLISETTPQGSVGYTYDVAGRRTTMTVAGQPQVSYTYDDANQLRTVTQGSAVVTLDYDEAGRRKSTALPNGLTVFSGYDAASQLTSLTYKQGSTTLGDLVYTYDLAGNRTKVGGSWARTGLPQAVSAATYNAANRLLTFGTATLAYDLNGNLSTATDPSGTATYTWDARNRLKTITASGLNAGFAYDALGRRTTKTINAVSTSFLYDGLNPVQEKAGASVTANILPGLGIDEYFTRTDSAGTRSILPDALGSTLALTDSTGTLTTQYTYEPFGNTSVAGAPTTSPFQYTARENDGTGLYYYRARYYSPRMQRFISEDPLGIGGGLNMYAYVDNAPTNYTDPLGLYGLPGAGGAATLSFVGQFSLNLRQSGGSLGRSLRCVNLSSVAISAAMGAVGPSFGSQFIRGIPGPWRLPLPQYAERIIYAEVWWPLGVLTKIASPEFRVGDLLKVLPSEFADPLGARKDDNCSALTLGNAFGVLFH